MPTPNTPSNSKGKKNADDSDSPDDSKISDSSSNLGDSNSSGSTTPRAIPLTTITSAPGANASFSSPPAPGPLHGGTPHPVSPINQSVVLEAHNFLPSATERVASAAPGSGERIFRRLQDEFTHLSKMEDSIRNQKQTLIVQEHTAKIAEKNAEGAAEKNKRESEKVRQETHVANAKWNAAVEVEKDNKEEKKRLKAFEFELVVREADLERREAKLRRRQAVLQRYTGGNLGATLASVGQTGPMQRSRDPARNDGDLSSSSNLLLHNSSAMFESAVDDPPRGRTLSSPHILQHQLLSTNPSDLPFRSRSNQFSPIHPRPVVARRGSSANLSIATPTPLLARRESDTGRIAAIRVTPDDVYDSPEEEEGDQSSGGEEERVEVQAQGAERPRGRSVRSVRRVSRNENLRRET